jgi:uncharacterized membrane protein YbhN (UPF0104 family)
MTTLAARRLLPIVVSVAFVAASSMAVGPARVLEKITRLDPGWMALGLLVSVPQIFISALRWKSTSERLGAPLPLARAWQEYYRSFFLNQVLPFGVVGDMLRADAVAGSSRRRTLTLTLSRSAGEGKHVVGTRDA